MRLLRIVITVNVALTALLVFGYLAYAMLNGLPVDKVFLGVAPGKLARGSGNQIPPWVLTAFAEAVAATLFIIGRRTNVNADRVWCGIIGIVGIWLLLVSSLSHHSASVAASILDFGFGWYVWCSNLAYAVIGPIDD